MAVKREQLTVLDLVLTSANNDAVIYLPRAHKKHDDFTTLIGEDMLMLGFWT